MSNTILIVDDEEDIREILSYNLKQAGYNINIAKDGKEALKVCRKNPPDMVIIDIMMPELDGIEACRQIKEDEKLKDVIVVFLTARSEEYNEVVAFDVGANDFIAKPIRPRALLSRIKAVLNRENKVFKKDVHEHENYSFSNLEFNTYNYTIKKDGKIVDLSKKEFELLLFLAKNSIQYHNRDILLKNIWGTDVYVLPRTIDVHIRKIREKLGQKYVKTKTGIGYRFNNV